MDAILGIQLHQTLAKYYQYTVKAMKSGVFYEWNTEPDEDVVKAHDLMMEEVNQFIKEE